VTVEKVLVGGIENVPQLEAPRRKGKIPSTLKYGSIG